MHIMEFINHSINANILSHSFKQIRTFQQHPLFCAFLKKQINTTSCELAAHFWFTFQIFSDQIKGPHLQPVAEDKQTF